MVLVKAVLPGFSDIALWKVSAYDVWQRANGEFISPANNRVKILNVDDVAALKNTRIYFAGENSEVVLDGLKTISGLDVACVDGSAVSIGSPQTIRGAVVMASHGAKVTIGAGCLISRDVVFYSSGAHALYGLNGERRGKREIKVGSRVWMGQGVRILGGAMVGNNSIIGSYSVLAGRIPNNCAAAGNPCRVTTKNVFWQDARADDDLNFFDRPENIGHPIPSYVMPTEDL